MGFLLRIFFLLAISVSLLSATAPLEGAVSQTEKSDCCVKVKTTDQQNDCGKQMPKSKKDQQCCVWCASGLTMILIHDSRVEPPKGDSEDLFAPAPDAWPAVEPPPVPPPRI